MKEQFVQNFTQNKKQATKIKVQSIEEYNAFLHHRTLHPRKTHNQHGKLVFSAHPAQQLLREDVRNGMHKNVTPEALRQTQEAFKAFTLDDFRPRIYQEVRRQKFINHLNENREKVEAAKKARFAKNKAKQDKRRAAMNAAEEEEERQQAEDRMEE